MEKFDVSLVLPCYNEAQTFNSSIKRIINVLDGTDYTWEIILVDDNSADGTQNLIKKAIRKYSRRTLRTFFHKKNQGRGKTVVEGIINAQGKIVGFIDIDLEVGEWYLPKFIQEIEKGAEVAIAWRVYDFNLKSLPRWFSSKGYIMLRKIFLNLPYEDTEAGYKFFKRIKILPIVKKCQYKGWFWDTEIMALVHKYKLKVVQIPVAFVRRYDKTSTVHLLPDTITYFKDLLSFKIKKR
jgi:dolichyl-phosphate beta-glucosyltransferase